MSLRLIEIILPQGYKNVALELISSKQAIDFWEEEIGDKQTRLKILLLMEKTESMMDALEKRFYKIEGFRMMLLSVEASIPRPQPEKEKPTVRKGIKTEKKKEIKASRVAREELYSDVNQMSKLSWVFIVLIVLASIVAAIGILRNNVVFIIGAMVIAPVLGPNVALSLGTTLGDFNLTRKAIRTIGVGIIAALVFSALIGAVYEFDTDIPELISRTEVNLGDIVLALAAGSAAALSITTGLLTALIGVMVAVALLPPLVTLGMLIGAGQWHLAQGALLLFFVNLICVNLAGVVTFLIRGIRPLSWWEAKRAKKATRFAVILWTSLLLVLVVLILIAQRT